VIEGTSEDCNENNTPDECDLDFATHPESRTVAAGVSVTFSFELFLSPSGSATYQWSKDDVEIMGASEATLTLDDVTADDDGDYTVEITDACLSATSNAATLTVEAAGDLFKRGDVSGDGTVFALVDGIAILEWAFNSGPEPTCRDAADVDDNGTVFALVDVIFLLEWAFNSGALPPDPGPSDCGLDPTDDSLDCLVPPAACN
jgi:hypothetical protein